MGFRCGLCIDETGSHCPCGLVIAIVIVVRAIGVCLNKVLPERVCIQDINGVGTWIKNDLPYKLWLDSTGRIGDLNAVFRNCSFRFIDDLEDIRCATCPSYV
jgi:hypothetical protein